MKILKLAIVVLLLSTAALTMTGCGDTTAPEIAAALNTPTSLTGTWTSTDASNGAFTGRWIKITFQPRHQLTAYFLAGNSVATNKDTYEIVDNRTLHVTEQDVVTTYRFAIDGKRLTLTMVPTADQQALVSPGEIPAQHFTRNS